jgi:hypothetical protein
MRFTRCKEQNMFFRLSIILICLLNILACRKANELDTSPNAKLSFSQDTIFFDTIFSSVGSITQRLIVYNPNKNKVQVSQIQLAGGANSPYSVIINGMPSSSVSNMDILGNDSIYILIKVLIDSTKQDLPFLVSDSLLFLTNTNQQKVLLESYGQNAHFYKKQSIPSNTIWTNDKPYVLYDTLTVPTGISLTIQEGCKIYGHNAAVLNVYGQLIVNGTKVSPVLFASDKTDKSYNTVNGLWGGLYFQTNSLNNSIQWATIRNAVTAIKMESTPDADTIAELTLSHVFLLHASQRMIDANNNDINGSNLLLSDCPMALLKHQDGCGVWTYCTFTDYSSGFFRLETDLLLGIAGTGLKMYALNSILWGDFTDEISINGGNPYINVQFSEWKSVQYSSGTKLINTDPLFNNTSTFDFTLQSSSPAIGLGTTVTAITDDIIGNTRHTIPDAGAYEHK